MKIISIKEIESLTDGKYICYEVQKSNGKSETIYSKVVNTGLWPLTHHTTREYFKKNSHYNINDPEIYKPIQDPETIRQLEEQIEVYYQRLTKETSNTNDAHKKVDHNPQDDITTTMSTPKSIKTVHRLRTHLAASAEANTNTTKSSSTSLQSWTNQAAKKLFKTWAVLTTIGNRLPQSTPKDSNTNKGLITAQNDIYKATPLALQPNMYNKSTASLPSRYSNNRNIYNKSAVSLASMPSVNASLSNTPVLNTPISHTTKTSLSNVEQLDNSLKSSTSQSDKNNVEIDPVLEKLETDINKDIEPYSISIYHNSREEHERELTPADREQFSIMTDDAPDKTPLKKIVNTYRTVLEIKDNRNGTTIATFIFKDSKESFLIRYKGEIKYLLGKKGYAFVSSKDFDVNQVYPLELEYGLSSAVALNFAKNLDIKSLAQKIQDQELHDTNTENFYKDISSNTPICGTGSISSQGSCNKDVKVTTSRHNIYRHKLTFDKYARTVSMGINCDPKIMKDILPAANHALNLTQQYMASHTVACDILGAQQLSDPNTIEIGVNRLEKSKPFIAGSDNLKNAVTNNTDTCIMITPDMNRLSKSSSTQCYYNILSRVYKNMGEGQLYDKILDNGQIYNAIFGKPCTPQKITKYDPLQPSIGFGKVAHDISYKAGDTQEPNVVAIHNMPVVNCDEKYESSYKAEKSCYEDDKRTDNFNDIIQDLENCASKNCDVKLPIPDTTTQPCESNSNVPDATTAPESTTSQPSHTPTKLTPWQKLAYGLTGSVITAGAIAGGYYGCRKCNKAKYDPLPDQEPGTTNTKQSNIEKQSLNKNAI